MKYIIQVEENGIRRLYGPVASLVEGRSVAEGFQARARNNEKSIRTMVKPLHDPPYPFGVPIDPNQTTIQDHIGEIHDAVL